MKYSAIAARIERLVTINLLCLTAGLSTVASAVSVSQMDRFTDGTLQGWRMGKFLTTQQNMQNIATGGPAGSGDAYLQVISDQTDPIDGNKITFFNKSQWAGDYVAAGISAIAIDLNNFNSTAPLQLRLAIHGGFTDPTTQQFIGGLYATTASLTLDSGSGWTHAVFSLAPDALTPVSGKSGVTGNDVNAALSHVLELRLLNSPQPAWSGPLVTATVGVDNIAAVPLPSAWWLFVSALLGQGWWKGRVRQGFRVTLAQV